MTTIELSPAYVWDCNECGRENFQRAVTFVLDPDDECDAGIIRAQSGIGPDDPIPPEMIPTMMTMPTRVTCKHCNTEYLTKNIYNLDDAEGDE